jgi:hypothetical protein
VRLQLARAATGARVGVVGGGAIAASRRGDPHAGGGGGVGRLGVGLATGLATAGARVRALPPPRERMLARALEPAVGRARAARVGAPSG